MSLLFDIVRHCRRESEVGSRRSAEGQSVSRSPKSQSVASDAPVHLVVEWLINASLHDNGALGNAVRPAGEEREQRQAVSAFRRA